MWKKLSVIGALAAGLTAAPALVQQLQANGTMQSGQSGQAQQYGQSGQSEQTQQYGQSGQTGQSGQAQSQSGQTGQTQSQSQQTAASSELKGQAVYSSDGEKVGEVAEVSEGSGGNVDSIHVDVGEFLGIGSKTVQVRSGQFTQNNDRVELSMKASEVKDLPEATTQ